MAETLTESTVPQEAVSSASEPSGSARSAPLSTVPKPEETREKASSNSSVRLLDGVSRDQYGEDYQKHIVEIYKAFVDSADKTSSRRINANSFFLTLNSALVGLLSLNLPGAGPRPPALMIAVALVGAVTCGYWRRLLRSHSDLNRAKFKVVHLIEAKLPIRPYDAEWQLAGEGKEPKTYLPVTKVERAIPLIFMALHSALAGIVAWSARHK